LAAAVVIFFVVLPSLHVAIINLVAQIITIWRMFAALLVEVCFGRILCRLGHALWVDALPPILCSGECFAAMVLSSFFFNFGGCFDVGVFDAVTDAEQP